MWSCWCETPQKEETNTRESITAKAEDKVICYINEEKTGGTGKETPDKNFLFTCHRGKASLT